MEFQRKMPSRDSPSTRTFIIATSNSKKAVANFGNVKAKTDSNFNPLWVKPKPAPVPKGPKKFVLTRPRSYLKTKESPTTSTGIAFGTKASCSNFHSTQSKLPIKLEEISNSSKSSSTASSARLANAKASKRIFTTGSGGKDNAPTPYSTLGLVKSENASNPTPTAELNDSATSIKITWKNSEFGNTSKSTIGGNSELDISPKLDVAKNTKVKKPYAKKAKNIEPPQSWKVTSSGPQTAEKRKVIKKEQCRVNEAIIFVKWDKGVKAGVISIENLSPNKKILYRITCSNSEKYEIRNAFGAIEARGIVGIDVRTTEDRLIPGSPMSQDYFTIECIPGLMGKYNVGSIKAQFRAVPRERMEEHIIQKIYVIAPCEVTPSAPAEDVNICSKEVTQKFLETFTEDEKLIAEDCPSTLCKQNRPGCAQDEVLRLLKAALKDQAFLLKHRDEIHRHRARVIVAALVGIFTLFGGFGGCLLFF